MRRNRHYTFLILALLVIVLIGAYGYVKKHRTRFAPITQAAVFRTC